MSDNVLENFNKDVTLAIMNGTMERQTYWIPGSVFSLRKRIDYHENKLSHYIEDKNLKKELELRLSNYRKELKNLDLSRTDGTYTTKINMRYSKDNAPQLLYYNSTYAYYRVDLVEILLKFSVSFKKEDFKTKWQIEQCTPNNNRYASRQGIIYSLERKGIDKNPPLLLTLSSLITPDLLIADPKKLLIYSFDFRNQ